MNHTYRLVWNVLAAVVCAAQGSRSHAAPTGGTVIAGQGTISQTGNTTTVQQQTQNLSVDWLSFSIAPSETVQFVQPSSTAVALNRVTGNDPSQIYGHLQANGQVFLINTNGALFGSTAQVDVGSLVASSLNLTDAGFLNGAYKFQGTAAATPASVINEGVINASEGGSIALLGGQVSNRGVITAQLGTVALAAGSAITLDFSGTRLLTVQVDQGAAGALAENRQLIQADGGKVIMTAAARDALLATVVNNTGVIEARTIQNQGGEISLLGSEDGGTVSVGGTLDASAPSGGNGGAIETSGAHVQVADSARISTAAPAGKTGTWLVDPTDFTISPSGGDISGATLSSELSSTNVTLTTTSGKVSGNGDLFVDDVVNWSADTTLTLNAVRNIQINSSIAATGNTAGLSLNFGSGGSYSLNYGSTITLSGSNPSFSINGQSYIVINSLGVAGDTSGTTLQGMNGNLSGYYALGSDINATASGGFSTGGFVPIGTSSQPFTGTLAGLGHVIKDLTVDPSISPGGLIGYAASGSVIRDVGIEGATVASTGNTDVGALVGENYGTIENTYADVTVSGALNVGGLVGENHGSITNSYTTGTVAGTNGVSGGLVGDNFGSVINDYSTANVSNQFEVVGGLVGDNWGTLSQSYATGSVQGNSYLVGGLAGVSEQGSRILNSYATGNVTSQGQSIAVGGLAGENLGSISGSYATGNVTATSNGGGYVGGLIGINGAGATISTSYYLNAIGQVNGGSVDYVGGLVGYNNGSVDQSYATTNVLGANSVGGLVGYAGSFGGAVVTRSYATGSVSGTGSGTGGLIGTNYGNILDCYTGAAVSGTGSNIGGFIGTVGGGTITNSYWIASGSTTDASTAAQLTAAQAEQSSSYVNWDFSTVWRIYAGHTAPLLKTFLTPLTVTADNISTTYNGQSYSGSLSNPTYSVSGADTSGHLLGLTTAYSGDRNAGTYASPDLWSDQQGYDISLVGGTLTINQAPLVVTTASVVKTYDGTTSAAGSAIATGGTRIFGADTLTGGTFAFTDANAGNNKTVNVGGVTVSDGNGGNNYSITYVDNTTSTINKASLTLAAGSTTKTYDGTTASAGMVGETGAVTGDTVNATEAYTSKNVLGAGNSTLQVNSGYTITDASGADMSGNYTITSTAAAGTINPAILTVSGTTAADKIYDGGVAATVSGSSLSGVIGSDSVSLFQTGFFSNKNVGANKSVLVDFGLTGSDAQDYILASTTAQATASITPKTLTVTGITANDKPYDGTAAATLNTSGATVTGEVSGDSLGIAAIGSFVNWNAGINRTVTLSNVVLTGADSGNYVLAASGNEAATTANIAPTALTITANNETKVAGAANPALTVTYSGFVSGENAATLTTAPMTSTTASTTSPAGTYTIMVSGAADPNYTITYVPGTLTATTNPATGITSSPGYLGALSSLTQLDPTTGNSENLKSESDDSEIYDGMLDIDTPKRVTDALPILALIILDKGIRLPDGVE